MKALPTIIIALLTTTACGDTFEPSDEARETWELTAEATAARDAAFAAAEHAQAAQDVEEARGAARSVQQADEAADEPEVVWGGDDVDVKVIEELVVDLVNEWRGQSVMCGDEARGPVQPLDMDVHLRNAARGHSKDLAKRNEIAHEGGDGSRFWDRAESFDGTPRGEAVAGGHPSAVAVVDAWMNSPDHCLVLMLPEATHVGVGYKFDKQTRFGHFWTLVVGTR